MTKRFFVFFNVSYLCHLLNLKSIKYKYKARKDDFYIHTIWSKMTFPWREATFGLSVLLIIVYHKYLTLIVCPTWTIKNVCSVQKFLWLHVLVRKKKVILLIKYGWTLLVKNANDEQIQQKKCDWSMIKSSASTVLLKYIYIYILFSLLQPPLSAFVICVLCMQYLTSLARNLDLR